MTRAQTAKSDRETNLDEVLAAYWRDVESGNPPDRRQLLERYPDISTELREYFADQDRVEQWTRPLRVIGQAATQPDLLADESLVGKCVGDYELLAEIGRGGMGVVYRARQKSLDRLVAVKLILTGRLASERECQRFRHEADAAAHLDHPRIVPIYEIGAHEGRPFFSMKLFEGGSVAERLKHYRANPRQAVDLVIAVTLAVHHAHRRGLLHRDLKPSNILLDADGQPHVADFGLAKWQVDQGQTQSGMIVGTPAFMAPEQAATSRERDRDGHAGAMIESDVYSLGAVLYTMLTGKPPFHGTTPLDTLLAVREQMPVEPALLNPLVDRDLNTICLKCLEKEPGRRYHTAEALAEDLDRWCAKLPIAAREISGGERVWRWCRRKPVLAGMTGAIALLLVFGIVALARGLVLIDRHRETAERFQKDAEEGAAVLRQRQYVADMGMAYRLWQRGDREGMVTLVQRNEPTTGEEDLRGFEWYYLRRLLQAGLTERVTFSGHGGIVYCATFSPDERTIASGGEDCTLRLWNAASGDCFAVLPGHTQDINWISYSPDGQTLASAGEDGTIRLWDLETKSAVAVLQNPTPLVECAVFSPDGSELATAGADAVIRLWDVSARTVAAELFGHEPTGFDGTKVGIEMLAYSADGQLLASAGHDGNVVIWDVKTRRLHQRFSTNSPVLGVALSEDATHVAAVDRFGTVWLWNIPGNKLMWKSVEHRGSARGVQFAPKRNDLIATCGDDGTVRLWQLETGRNWDRIETGQRHVWSVQFSPDGRRLVTAGRDHTVKVWDIDQLAGKQQVPMNPAEWKAIDSLQFSPDGRTLATGGRSGQVGLWDVSTTQLRATLTGHSREADSVWFSPDGHWLATGAPHDRVLLWNATAGQPMRGDSGELLSLEGFAAVFAPDDGGLVTATREQLIWWDWPSRRIRRQLPIYKETLESIVTKIGVSPDARTLAAALNGGRVLLWDLSTGTTRFMPGRHGLNITRLAFSPNGELLASASADSTTKLWDMATGQELATLLVHDAPVNAVAFTPDGRTLATGDSNGVIKLWHVATRQELFTLDRHPGVLCDLAFSPDGRTLATGGHLSNASIPLLFLWHATRENDTTAGR